MIKSHGYDFFSCCQPWGEYFFRRYLPWGANFFHTLISICTGPMPPINIAWSLRCVDVQCFECRPGPHPHLLAISCVLNNSSLGIIP